MTSLVQMVQVRLSGIAGSPRQFVTVRFAAILGRTDLPSRRELMALRPATRVLILGFAAWTGLVGLLTLSAVISLELSRVTTPAWFASPGVVAKASEARSAAGFENIVQRPLFSRSRQGFVAVEPAAAPPPLPPSPSVRLDQSIILKGVFMSDGFAKAFLITSQNPLGVWVQVNAEIEGWRVAAVAPGQIVLEGQNEKLAIPLSVTGVR
jgi:hypothetical protein